MKMVLSHRNNIKTELTPTLTNRNKVHSRTCEVFKFIVM